MRKAYKKINRILWFSLIIILGLFLFSGIFAIFYLQSNKGSEFLTSQTGSILSDRMGTTVEIGSVHYKFPLDFDINELFVKDLHGDTLLFVPDARLGISHYDFFIRSLFFEEAILVNPRIRAIKNLSDTDFNYMPIIRNLRKGEGGGKGVFRVFFEKVTLVNGTLTYDKEEKPHSEEYGIDWNHLKITSLNIDADYLQIIRDKVNLRVNKLSLKEKSGFRISSLQTNFYMDENNMDFRNLSLETPYSRLGNEVSLYFSRTEDFQDFINKVRVEADLENSHLSFRDLAFFANELPVSNQVISLSGRLTGKVKSFRSRDFAIQFGKESFFRGELSFNGLPNIQETFIDISFKNSRIIEGDIYYLFPKARIPLELNRLGKVKFKGRFTGFVYDFVADGDFRTALGNFSTDINLKNPTDKENAKYTGKLDLNNFNLGMLFQEKLLGRVTMNANINGKGLTLGYLNANLDADIRKLEFKDYSYRGIDLSGTIAHRLFQGDLVINDPNIDMDFSGDIDLKATKPAFDFTADIKNANFLALNIVKDTLLVNGKVKMGFNASNIDNMEGEVLIEDLDLKLSDRFLFFDSLYLTSRIDTSGTKFLSLNSDIADINLSGSYNLTNIQDLGKSVLSYYFDPSLLRAGSLKKMDQDIGFDIHLKNAAFLMELVRADFVVENNSRIAGFVDGASGEISLNGLLPGIYFKNLYFNNISFEGKGGGEDLFFKAGFNNLYRNDSLLLKNGFFRILTEEDSVNFNIVGESKTGKDGFNIFGKAHPGKNKVDFRVFRSDITYNDSTWEANSYVMTYFYDSSFVIPLLRLQNGDQYIRITGEGGENENLPLRMVVENLETDLITELFVPQLTDIYDGRLNGQITIFDILGDPYFNSAFVVSPLTAGVDTIGVLSFYTNYNRTNKRVNLTANLMNFEQEPVADMTGYISFKGDNRVDLKIQTPNTDLALIEPLVNRYVTDPQGNFTGLMNIKGTFKDLKMSGFVDLEDAYFTIDYLKTRYHFTEIINFDQDKIYLNNITFLDHKGDKAFGSGVINHNAFRDFYVDAGLTLDNFQVLNTTLADNDLYYGVAYASGAVDFLGKIRQLNMDMQLRSEPNTRIFLPLDQSSDYSGYNFIQFIEEEDLFARNYDADESGLTLDMDLELTPDAEMQIIFDSRVGDIIKGRGNGNITMEINTAGDFSMFGEYYIQEGDYLFTAFDLINKRFKIREGGVIKWTGDPINADIDLEAYYKLRANVSPLLTNLEGEDEVASSKLPVEAQLFLSGSLLSPEVRMDFILPETGNFALENRLQTIKNDERELNNQVVSLLVFNRFMQVGQGIQVDNTDLGEGGISSLSDLVSNQLSYWLSQTDIKYIEDVEIGLNYGANNNATGLNERDLELALSTTLFDDRVYFSGSYVSGPYSQESINGNFEISYKITRDGNMRVKVFSRQNTNPISNENILTQGAGLYWKKEFDDWEDFFSGKKKTKPQPKEDNNTEGDAILEDENIFIENPLKD